MKPLQRTPSSDDLQLVKLAREVAMDIHPLETILRNHDIGADAWFALQNNHRFRALVISETEAWNTALNTHERVKVKAACMVEEWLPELHARLHDGEEALPAKVEAGKLLTRIAGMGLPGEVNGVAGERFTVTINMGPQIDPIQFTKEVTSKVIENEVV
jgi:hypothetical protein